MANATGFQVDLATCDIKMNRGDTGSFWVVARRKSEAAWTEDDRLLFTIRDGQNEIVLQRFYRLDDQWGQGDGIVLIEFHNDDTDELPAGDYTIEGRANVSPIWDGTPSAARCVNALADGAAHMIEGVPVRTLFKCTLHIDGVDGRI